MAALTQNHGERINDAIDIEGFALATFTISSTGAQSAALEEGIYDVWADTDCYIKVAPTASDVLTTTGYLLRANNTVPVLVRKDSKIGAITASASGNIYFHKVG